MLNIIIYFLLLLPFCLGSRNLTKRIVGGQEVGWDRYPYFALLEIKWKQQTTDPTITDWCGSVVIASSSLLTAAHCLQKPNIESVTATIGIYDLEDDPTRQVVTAQSWVLHPLFDRAKVRNDIAIVRLVNTVSVKPVSIAFESGFPKVGTMTKVFGFGKESPYEEEISDELLEISITVSRTSLCQEKFGKENFVSSTQICAGGLGKVPCRGDSGGPMIVKGFSGKPDVIAGIISFGGIECNQRPAVFTRVSAYKKWLEESLCRPRQPLPPRWCGNGGTHGNPNKRPIKRRNVDKPLPSGARPSGPRKLR